MKKKHQLFEIINFFICDWAWLWWWMKKSCKNVKFDENYDDKYVMWNRQIETWCVDWKNIMKKENEMKNSRKINY